MKGSALSSRLRWLRLNHGQPGVDRLAAAVSPGVAALVRDGVAMATWYAFDAFIELNVAMDKMFGHGDLALVRELGRYSADANLTTIYRLFFKVGTPRWILARSARLWNAHYDVGRLLTRELADQEHELRIDGFSEPHRVHCLSIQGWVERSVELSGGEEVVLTEPACRALGDATCRFVVRWR